MDFYALTAQDLVDWGWLMPHGPEQKMLYENCAGKVLEKAVNVKGTADERQSALQLQKEIQRLDGDKACIPAFYWGIIQTLNFERNSQCRRDDELEKEEPLERLTSITDDLRDVLIRFNRLIVDTDKERRLLIDQFRGDQFEVEQLFELRLNHFGGISSKLRDAIGELESQVYFYGWQPASRRVRPQAVDKYSVQFLFAIASEMFGDRRWEAVFTIMDVMAPILGYTNPFTLESEKESWKYLRRKPNNYEQHFRNAITRHRLDFIAEMDSER